MSSNEQLSEEQIKVIALQHKAKESMDRYPSNPAKATVDFTLRAGFPLYCQYLGELQLSEVIEKIVVAQITKDNVSAKAEIDKAKAFEGVK